MYSRLETFVDEPRAFALLWIKLSELAIHASFTREFSPATRPFSPSRFSHSLSLFLCLFYSSVSLPDTNVLDKYEFIAALAWNVYSKREEIFFSLRPPISSHRG